MAKRYRYDLCFYEDGGILIVNDSNSIELECISSYDDGTPGTFLLPEDEESLKKLYEFLRRKLGC